MSTMTLENFVPKNTNLPTIKEIEIAYKQTDLDAVKRNGMNLKWIKYKTPEICAAAVGQNAMSIQYVPDTMQTDALCELAIHLRPIALQHIAKQTVKLCLSAIRVMPSCLALVRIPQTREMVITAVKKEWAALRHARIQDEEICLTAVRTNPNAIQFVWKPSPVVIRTALEQDGLTLAFIPHDLLTSELCTCAVAQNGAAIAYCRKWYSPELLKLALKTYPDAYVYDFSK